MKTYTGYDARNEVTIPRLCSRTATSRLTSNRVNGSVSQRRAGKKRRQDGENDEDETVTIVTSDQVYTYTGRNVLMSNGSRQIKLQRLQGEGRGWKDQTSGEQNFSGNNTWPNVFLTSKDQVGICEDNIWKGVLT